MGRGIARHTDAQVGMLRAQETHEVTGVVEMARVPVPVAHAARRIPAQGQHVVDPGSAQMAHKIADGLRLGAHTGQVRHDGEAPPGQLRRDVQRVLLFAAPRTVGDGEEKGIDRAQALHGLVELRQMTFRGRGKKFQRNKRLGCLAESLGDLHDKTPGNCESEKTVSMPQLYQYNLISQYSLPAPSRQSLMLAKKTRALYVSRYGRFGRTRFLSSRLP